MISQGAWVVRIVGAIGLYLITWAVYRPKPGVGTVIALATWALPMIMWWINSENIYQWLLKKMGKK